MKLSETVAGRQMGGDIAEGMDGALEVSGGQAMAAGPSVPGSQCLSVRPPTWLLYLCWPLCLHRRAGSLQGLPQD